MKIVPAILTDQREDLQTLLNRAEQFAEYVQIDFMDGSFVPSRSVFPQDLQGIGFQADRVSLGGEYEPRVSHRCHQATGLRSRNCHESRDRRDAS